MSKSKYESLANPRSSLRERLKNFYQSSKRIIKVATKPSRKDYWLVTKICLVGMVILGVISYVVQLIGFLLQEFVGQ